MTLQITWATETETTNDAGDTEVGTAFHILEFDAVTSEEHSAESELTSHVVETTEAISDHKRPKPRRINIEATVTNTPLGFPPSSGFNGRAVSAEVRKQVGDAKANVVVFSEEFDRITDVEQTLDRLRREAIDLTVATRVRTYENVQLVSVSIPRKDPVDAIDIRLELREVFRAETQTVDAPQPREPRGQGRRASASEPREETVAEDADEDTADQSLLTRLIGSIG